MTTVEMPEDLSVAIQKRFAVEPGTSEWQTVLRTWGFYQELKRTWAAERQALRRAEGKALNGNPGHGRRMVGRKGQRKSVPDPGCMALMDAITRWHEGEGLSFRAIRGRLIERGVLVRGRKPSLSLVRRMYLAARPSSRPGPELGACQG